MIPLLYPDGGLILLHRVDALCHHASSAELFRVDTDRTVRHIFDGSNQFLMIAAS